MTSSEFTHCFWTRQGLPSFSKNINQNSCFTKMKRPSLVLKQWILRERPRDKLLHSIVHFVNLLVPRFLHGSVSSVNSQQSPQNFAIVFPKRACIIFHEQGTLIIQKVKIYPRGCTGCISTYIQRLHQFQSYVVWLVVTQFLEYSLLKTECQNLMYSLHQRIQDSAYKWISGLESY